MTGPSEDSKLRAFLRGESRQVRQVERWAKSVASSPRFGIPASERDDIVQEAMISLYRAAARSGRPLRSTLRAFVRHVAASRCIDWLRKSRPRVGLTEEPPDPSPPPDYRIQLVSEFSGVRLAMDRLGDKCRQIIILRFDRQFSFEEISQRTGVKESTLRVRLFDCLKRIRHLMRSQKRDVV